MELIQSQIKEIHEKLQELLRKQQQLEKDNQRLQKELAAAHEQLSSKSAALQAMQQQSDALRMGQVSWTQEDKHAMQKRIDAYLKEIDQCLSLLNQHWYGRTDTGKCGDCR